MTRQSPERSDTSMGIGSTVLLGGIVDAGVRIVNYFREWHELNQVEKRSRRYVDSLFDCLKTGGITGRQVLGGLSLDNERVESLRLNRYFVNSHAFHRIIRLDMRGY